MNDIDLDDLDDLAAELTEFAPREKKDGPSADEEAMSACFEELQFFTKQHGRAPQHSADRDIFERIYAVQLDRIRAFTAYHPVLAPLDEHGLLAATLPENVGNAPDALAAELVNLGCANDITALRHVRTSIVKNASEVVAQRKPCADFETFQPLFERVRVEVNTGLRQAQKISAANRGIEVGAFFVLDGLTLYIAEVGEPLKTTAGEVDRRLRIIFSNATESNLLLRSLQRAFYDDRAARRLVSPTSGQLSFGAALEADDIASGTIYVLRSESADPYITQHRDVIHKIGVTGGRVETRIANAENEATYLLAPVEVVATYKLAGINRSRMENLFHRLFAAARLKININDRFGHPVQPEEWFVVPLGVIDEAVARIMDGSITGYIYDVHAAKLVKSR